MLLYDLTREDLIDAICLRDNMKEEGYNVSLTDVLIANLNISIEDTVERLERSLYNVTDSISYLQ